MYKKKYLINLQALILITSCILMSEVFAEDCREESKGFAVVELFTSEGCSDCPPADKNLIELSKLESSKNIYALAFHVTYWDYIGWKDPFGKQEFTERQEKYSSILRGGNYTPQAVVNGSIDIVGSKQKSLYSTIENELLNPSRTGIQLDIVRKGNIFEVKYGVSCVSSNDILNLAIIEKELFSVVTKGENRGKTLQHRNVVRSFQSIVLTKFTGSIKMEYAGIEKNPKNFEIISYLQDSKTYKIMGARRVKLD